MLEAERAHRPQERAMSYRTDHDPFRRLDRRDRGFGAYLRSRSTSDWLFFAGGMLLGAWLF
jgi:hypothetical protein